MEGRVKAFRLELQSAREKTGGTFASFSATPDPSQLGTLKTEVGYRTVTEQKKSKVKVYSAYIAVECIESETVVSSTNILPKRNNPRKCKEYIPIPLLWIYEVHG